MLKDPNVVAGGGWLAKHYDTTISAPSHLEYEFSIRNPSILDHIHLRIISIAILISAEDSEQ